MITLGEGGLGQFSLLSGLGYALTRGDSSACQHKESGAKGG